MYLEPGRFLVGSAGVLLTEVLYRKHSGGKEFVVVDAGMNDLVRPSHYQAYHEIVELERTSGRPVRADVVGPVCETGDFLALDRDAARTSRRAIASPCSARAPTASSWRRTTTRGPGRAEVVVDGDRWWVARRGRRSSSCSRRADGPGLIAGPTTGASRPVPQHHDGILIIDFGSQYTQLIARRVREAHVYCEIHPPSRTVEWIRDWKPKGIILSGGPNSVYGDSVPTADPALLELGTPVLGLCYGMQLLAHLSGGNVTRASPARVRPRQRDGSKAAACSTGSARARRRRSG